jgi:hypothetical protein
MRLVVANAFDGEEIRLHANGRLPRVPRKLRNESENSTQLKDEKNLYVRYLRRGGEGGLSASRLKVRDFNDFAPADFVVCTSRVYQCRALP